TLDAPNHPPLQPRCTPSAPLLAWPLLHAVSKIDDARTARVDRASGLCAGRQYQHPGAGASHDPVRAQPDISAKSASTPARDRAGLIRELDARCCHHSNAILPLLDTAF